MPPKRNSRRASRGEQQPVAEREIVPDGRSRQRRTKRESTRQRAESVSSNKSGSSKSRSRSRNRPASRDQPSKPKRVQRARGPTRRECARRSAPSHGDEVTSQNAIVIPPTPPHHQHHQTLDRSHDQSPSNVIEIRDTYEHDRFHADQSTHATTTVTTHRHALHEDALPAMLPVVRQDAHMHSHYLQHFGPQHRPAMNALHVAIARQTQEHMNHHQPETLSQRFGVHTENMLFRAPPPPPPPPQSLQPPQTQHQVPQSQWNLQEVIVHDLSLPPLPLLPPLLLAGPQFVFNHDAAHTLEATNALRADQQQQNVPMPGNGTASNGARASGGEQEEDLADDDVPLITLAHRNTDIFGRREMGPNQGSWRERASHHSRGRHGRDVQADQAQGEAPDQNAHAVRGQHPRHRHANDAPNHHHHHRLDQNNRANNQTDAMNFHILRLLAYLRHRGDETSQLRMHQIMNIALDTGQDATFLQYLDRFSTGGDSGALRSDEIARLCVIKFRATSEMSQDVKQCSICIEDFQDDESVRLLPCLHRFHDTCSTEWLQRSGTCPICKDKVRRHFKEADRYENEQRQRSGMQAQQQQQQQQQQQADAQADVQAEQQQ